jgi:predicted phage-related endonuclease
VSERYPNFDLYIEQVTNWWNTYVLTGISPEFDEKKDAEILNALRTNCVEIPTDISSLLKRAEELKTEITEITCKIADKEKELKTITDEIKSFAMKQFRDGDNKVSIKGKDYEFVLSKTNSAELDTKSLAQDMGEDFMNKYTKQKTSYRLTTSKIKED